MTSTGSQECVEANSWADVVRRKDSKVIRHTDMGDMSQRSKEDLSITSCTIRM
jgi:hypothetical protein